jgi:two-component system chemotaxis response regulator CheB
MPRSPTDIQVVAIGTSTGGPLVLQTILASLPRDFPMPVLIVQHMASGFVQGFVEWLAQSSGFPVHIAADSEYLWPGHAYVAPDGFHMKVSLGHRIALSREAPDNGLRPSVSRLFQSVAQVFEWRAFGVLLTGMGKDGAEELKLLKDKGAITMAQDKDSAVVHGMPGEAIKLDAATYVLPPDRMAAMLTSLVQKKGTAL